MALIMTVMCGVVIVAVGGILTPWMEFGKGCVIGLWITTGGIFAAFIYDSLSGWKIRRRMRELEGLE